MPEYLPSDCSTVKIRSFVRRASLVKYLRSRDIVQSTVTIAASLAIGAAVSLMSLDAALKLTIELAISASAAVLLFVQYVVRTRKWLLGGLEVDKAISRFNGENLRKVMRGYVNEALARDIEIVNNLSRGNVELSRRQVERLMVEMFKTDARYMEIDYNLPSYYYDVYHYYLDHHIELATRIKDKGFRITVRDDHELRRDSRKSSYSKFLKWHKDNGVKLKWAPAEVAEKELQKTGVDPNDRTGSICIWEGEFALLFARSKPDPDARPEYDMIRITLIEGKRLEELTEACNSIEKNAKGIEELDLQQNIPDLLAKEWEDYVRPKERWDRIGGFLCNSLEKCRVNNWWIMDVAAGMGVEYQNLNDEKFHVVANEAQENFRKAGEVYAREEWPDVRYDPSHYEWEEMHNYGKVGYGAVLAIGHSLRALPAGEEQEKALKTFHDMLVDGGSIIIDETNFARLHEKVRDCLHRCNQNPDDKDMFKEMIKFVDKSPSPLYRGNTVKAIPSLIDADAGVARLVYYKRTKGIDTFAEAVSERLHEREFHYSGSLHEMLENAGFKNIRKYADYDLSLERKPGDKDSDASMFVYVADK
ncbi:hypothetical protein CENSYa_0275 [Cenarchaeum symbiosum A]|uniref:Methyltransferase domain-containing protein n=1 Tax=Cenarchaeum symbiosum (strain A) TaxID=414004 RepID=A0RU98_CENSY|nr:hypothetical protein CENSYa_0275 [Cenarchaeum symbiosum A]